MTEHASNFELTRDPIDPSRYRDVMEAARAGAFVQFEGWVRDHHRGRAVSALEYEVYEELALTEGTAVVQEALERFEVLSARCVHRIGRLNIGDLAVWVGATAAHRQAAFDACRYVIDETKQRVPIWKKERYTDGDAHWIHSEPGAGA
jgi:molybdopterin synthase catalytic subunit